MADSSDRSDTDKHGDKNDDASSRISDRKLRGGSLYSMNKKVLERRRAHQKPEIFAEEQNSPLLVKHGPAEFNMIRHSHSAAFVPSQCANGHLFGPPPEHQLGHACVLCGGDQPEEKDKTKTRQLPITDPTSTFFRWSGKPTTVFIIKKIDDTHVTESFKTLATWLIQEKGMSVYVEPNVLQETLVCDDSEFTKSKESLQCPKSNEHLEEIIDLVVCLGGDGTLLHTSSLFQKGCPPILSFHLGTFGFLMPFQFNDFKKVFKQTLEDESVGVILRNRLRCLIIDNEEKDHMEFECLALNELVVDRGSSVHMLNLDITCSGNPLTTLISDGLIISTPTGSSAYAAAAGASMVHPAVPGIVIAPICPQSLSFRPIVVPAGIELKVHLSSDSKRSAWASFDGRNRKEITKSKCIRITTSIYPLPCVVSSSHLSDWFESLAECRHWNIVGARHKAPRSDH
eukprot:gene15212-16783_t